VFRKTREKSPYYLVAVDFGYTLLAAIGIFGWLGWLADRRFGTTPWLMLVGFGLGMAVGFNGLFRRLNLLEQDRKAARKREKEKEPPPRA
jgi:F0F1-type ATP synthase assembly protein I